jgi:hypothetical protein
MEIRLSIFGFKEEQSLFEVLLKVGKEREKGKKQ